MYLLLSICVFLCFLVVCSFHSSELLPVQAPADEDEAISPLLAILPPSVRLPAEDHVDALEDEAVLGPLDGDDALLFSLIISSVGITTITIIVIIIIIITITLTIITIITIISSST